MSSHQTRSPLQQAWNTASWAYNSAAQGLDQARTQAVDFAEAGNAAAQEALRTGAAGVQGLQDTASSWVDQGASMLGEVRDDMSARFLGGPGGPAGAEQGALVSPELAGEGEGSAEEQAEEQAEVEQAPAYSRGDTYLNQRDNESEHVAADVSCSPTSFTMALIDRHGGDEESVRTQAIALINERGGDSSLAQTEELIIELLQVVDWGTATSEKPAFFWNPAGWATWARTTYGGRYYKDPNAQQYVASLFTGTTATEAQVYSQIYTAAAWAPVIAALEAGASASGEGAFTTSGHVVDIVNADASGVTINDPYGLWLRSGQSYLRNGAEQVPELGADDLVILNRRASTNGAIRTAYDSFDDAATAQVGFARWGERNFYSWADVDRVKLGKWVSVIS